jgi:peroxiredoxin/predicted 2-oxoglutarate/Fe(II)-dependent dioxygenase YbiX
MRWEPAMPAPEVNRHRPAFEPVIAGDIAPQCVLPALDGNTVDLYGDEIAGNPIVMVFCPRFSPAVAEALAGFRSRLEQFVSAGARLFAVTLERAKEAKARAIPFPVLIDKDGRLFRDFGANRQHLPTTALLRPNHHVLAIINGACETQAPEALALVQQITAERRSVLMAPHPPVLTIPDVLSREDCRYLINVFETRGKTFLDLGPGIDYIGADYKMRVPEHGRRDRIDHWIVENDTAALLDHRLVNRVIPEVAKAFHYHITRYERMRIGCYEGSRGGKLHGHRDNFDPSTAYRRFAMSVNLNTEEFEGGELRFPEYGSQRYRPDTGSAIVFSSSLLHEALHATSGRRFVLLAFLFGER